MSVNLKELIEIAKSKADLDEGIDKDEWDKIDKFNEEELDIYFREIGNIGNIRFIYSFQRRELDSIKDRYESNKIDFKGLRILVDSLFKSEEKKEDFSAPITEKEKKYGYSWAFFQICNKSLGISLRKLEIETGISKDVLHRYIKNYEERLKNEYDLLQAEKNLKEIKQKREQLEF